MVEAVGVLRAVYSAVAALQLHTIEVTIALLARAFPDGSRYVADADHVYGFVARVCHKRLLVRVDEATPIAARWVTGLPLPARTDQSSAGKGGVCHATCPCQDWRSG